LFWTDASTSNPKIERASMDGTSRTVLHSTGLTFPSGITLDYTSQTLYWIDAARLRIESSGVDGSPILNYGLICRILKETLHMHSTDISVWEIQYPTTPC